MDGTDDSPIGERWTEDGQDQRSYDTSGNDRNDRTGINIPVALAKIDSTEVAGAPDAEFPYVLWQKGARRFRVRLSGSLDGNCKLVSGESALASGEMVLKGYVDGAGDGVALRKISGRKAYDFDSNAYTWYVDSLSGDDSTLDNAIVLTAI